VKKINIFVALHLYVLLQTRYNLVKVLFSDQKDFCWNNFVVDRFYEDAPFYFFVYLETSVLEVIVYLLY